jgi:hypothetical protein
MTVYADLKTTGSTIAPPWDHVHDGSNGPNGNTSAATVSTPLRGATGTAIRLRSTPDSNGGSIRAEVGTATRSTPHSSSAPDEAYYGCSVYFPSSNSGNWSPFEWDGQNVWQWITQRGDGSTFSALGYFYVNTGDYGLTTPHLQFEWNVTSSGGVSDRAAGHWDLGAITYNSWYDLVVHIKWSTSSSGGLVEVWVNGTKQFSQTCRTFPPDGTVYTEIQNYRANSGGQTDIFFDLAKIGDSYAAVDPSAGGGGGGGGGFTGQYFSDSFETGDFSKWDAVQDGINNNPVNGNTVLAVSSAIVRSGTHSAKFQANDNTGSAASYEAANLVLLPANCRGSLGLETYYGFSVYFDSTSRGNWPGGQYDWNNFIEWLGGSPTYGGPPIQMGLDTGDYPNADPHMYCNLNVKPDGTGYQDRSGGRWQDPNPVPYDTWIDFVVHITWQSSATGLLEVWKNGVLLFSWTNVRTMYPGDAANGVQWEPQMYGPARGATTTMYMDSFATAATYAGADPSGGVPPTAQTKWVIWI